MSFLFRNKSIKTTTDKLKSNDPLPGFFKTEPSFNMDYTLPQEREDLKDETPKFSGTSFHNSYDNSLEEIRKGPVIVTISNSGIIGILFALLLLGVLFFMTGFLSGMMVTEYAIQSQSGKKMSESFNDLSGDDNV